MKLINLRLFDANVQTTGSADLSVENKTYYEKRLIDNAEPELVYSQFGSKYPIPKNGGKTIEFRKFDPFPKALTPLTEGVTPDGRSLKVTNVTATVSQYGDYVTLSDILDLTAIDPVVEETTKLCGGQAGRTIDTITRDIICNGSNVIFSPTVSGSTETEISTRSAIDTSSVLDAKRIRKAAAILKRANAKPIDDSYVAIIHPDIACDLQGNSEWIEAHKYATPENIYNGEIGKLAGVRFVESSEAKIIGPSEICGIAGLTRTTAQANASSGQKVVKPNATITSAQVAAFSAAKSAGATFKVYVKGVEYTVDELTAGAPGTAAMTMTANLSANVTAGDTICGVGAGKDGSAVYCTLIVGSNAYGETEVEGGGLQHIVKQLGSAGTADPLNQRSSVGWKATHVAERLVEAYMVRIEHSSATFGATAESN